MLFISIHDFREKNYTHTPTQEADTVLLVQKKQIKADNSSEMLTFVPADANQVRVFSRVDQKSEKTRF